MKSYIIDAYIKTLDELPSKYSEKAPEPKPGQNDVLIDVFASALNFFGQSAYWLRIRFVLKHSFSCLST